MRLSNILLIIYFISTCLQQSKDPLLLPFIDLFTNLTVLFKFFILQFLQDIERFSRAYVLRCGLTASEQELTKSDTGFVKDTILAGTLRCSTVEQSTERHCSVKSKCSSICITSIILINSIDPLLYTPHCTTLHYTTLPSHFFLPCSPQYGYHGQIWENEF